MLTGACGSNKHMGNISMGTVAFDPELSRASTLPPGGCPGWDDEFMEWVRDFVRQINLCHALIAGRSLLNEHQLTGHLFKWLGGVGTYPQGITYQHRLRHCAIQFHYRQPELIAEADRYAERLAAADAEHARLF
jgi:hypothetical protein